MENTTTIVPINVSKLSPHPEHRILLFDLITGGHHPSYIRHLIEYWCHQKLSGILDIVVSPQFLELHQDVINISLELGENRVKFIPISLEELSLLESQKSSIKKFFIEWNIFCQYAKKQRATQAILMYIDHLQLPLAFGQKSPCPVGGIYFRPTFHYSNFANLKLNRQEIFRQWRQKLVLFIAMQNSQLNYLYCLDNFAVEHISQLSKKVTVLPLADPVDTIDIDTSKYEKLNTELGIDKSKSVFLLFGVLDNRKGIYPLLDAIKLLPIDIQKKICLLLAGPIPPSEREEIEKRILLLSQNSPIQIILKNKCIPSKEVGNYFELADFVLVPYQKHVGMSSVIVHAAAAQKPVLTSNYGLLGQLVQEHQLGLTFDSTSPAEIAQSIQKVFAIPGEEIANLEAMYKFASQNSSQKFAHQIFHDIYKLSAS
ncbi:glycosyltransferase [Brunnivagina elsteri]|uniref:Glycosyl transferase family 1 n=1 Tax=Brunnivagina elsteri CCALA 953 TaxID=987040 RepID=A0A2A2THG1_9CYAN|nr:glycosyltransferase [Calothrix elsteri]PAX53162.1 glycosyl transferase family 1 [Calothrix elsteri CCALA 953]